MILNDSKEAVALSYIVSPLKPMVDDFAQIVGTKMKKVKNDEKAIVNALKKADAVFVEGYGAVCKGADKDDAEAVSMIVEKNCRAFMIVITSYSIHYTKLYEKQFIWCSRT